MENFTEEEIPTEYGLEIGVGPLEMYRVAAGAVGLRARERCAGRFHHEKHNHTVKTRDVPKLPKLAMDNVESTDVVVFSWKEVLCQNAGRPQGSNPERAEDPCDPRCDE